MWVRGHSRSLKLVSFERLGAVCYSPSVVTMAVSVAVCEIFSVKEWRDLENQVRGRSRSLKMALFDRPYATFYWSAIVNSSILCHFRIIWRWTISWLWNRGYRSLNVIEASAIRKVGCGILFAFYSNCGRKCSRLWGIQYQKMAWPWKLVWKWRRSIDHMQFSIGPPL